MRIVEDEEGVRIEGEGSERARIGYAGSVDGRLASYPRSDGGEPASSILRTEAGKPQRSTNEGQANKRVNEN